MKKHRGNRAPESMGYQVGPGIRRSESDFPTHLTFPDELSPKQLRILVDDMEHSGVRVEIIEERVYNDGVHLLCFILNGFELVDYASLPYVQASEGDRRSQLEILIGYREMISETEY